MQKDYYKILAIPKNTESVQMKQKAQNVLDKATKEYETHLMEMKKAYSIIANSVRRQDYDRKLKAESSTQTNFYQILRIAPYTNQPLVKELTQNTVNTVKQEYKSKIAEIREAYSVLGDTQKRAAYDNTRLQEEDQRETRRRQRQAMKKTPRRFSLIKLILPVLVIGLMYFGYTQYQSVPYSAEEEFQTEQPTIHSNYRGVQPTINPNYREVQPTINPSYQVQPTINPNYREVQPTVNPSYREEVQPTINPNYREEPEVLQTETKQPVSNPNVWEEAKKLQAEEKQPDSLSFSSWEEGADGYETIMTTAHSLEEPVILYFHADWCPWCKKLERNYFSHDQFKEFLNNILRVKMIPDNSAEEKQLFKQYKGTGYPSIFIYIPAFGSRHTKMYPFRKGEDWTPEKFIHKLRDYIVLAYSKHAYHSQNKGQYEEARYYYRKALLYNRENADIFFRIGLTYHKEGYEKRDVKRLLLAKASYLEALKYEPNHQETLNNLKGLKNLVVPQ